MSKEYYRYNGQIYQYTSNEKQFRDVRSSERRIILLTVAVVVLAIICISINILINNTANDNLGISGNYNQNSAVEDFITDPPSNGSGDSDLTVDTDNLPVLNRPPVLSLISGSSTQQLSGIDSTYAIVIDRKTGEIIASKNGNTRMFPASMTKVMSILVAYEYMLDHDIDIMSTYITMTQDILDYTIKEGASNAGFTVGEEVRIIDVFHGATLPSGADAVLMLANFCYGSESAFVDMMNAKVLELGLGETHFVTSTGLHDPEHFTTVAEMAVIVDYACKYDFLKELLETTNYTYGETNKSTQRKTSSTLYNWRTAYSTNPEKTEISGASAFGGKSGYTPEAKYCLASYLDMQNGDSYIVITGYASKKTATISDYLHIYNNYALKN